MSSSPPDGRLRGPREGDFDAILDLMNAAQFADYGEADRTAEDLRTWLTSPSVVPESDVRLLERDGRLLGYVDADFSGDERKLWWSEVAVAPEADADEVVPPLVGWLEHRAGSGTLRVWTSATSERMLAAFRRLGFRERRHSYRMTIELRADLPEPRWPDGISVRTYEEPDELAVYEAHREVWRDTSDPLEETLEEWRHWMTRRESFDPSLWFLARAGAEIAGFSLCVVAKPGTGWVDQLGVRRPWRRRGLAEALLLQSFRAFRARGFRRVSLGVDGSSPTGATRLYERAGMTVYRDTVFLDRPVEA
jgi:mycothiol synthase